MDYSAGTVSKGLWFQEFKKYNTLVSEGLNDSEIKRMQEEENILLAPSSSYGKKMINEVSRRTRAIPIGIIEIFSSLSVSDQKILNVLGIMMTDRLFFEYMYEVYREKIMIGDLEFSNSNTRRFLDNKSEQSEKVLNFTSQTKKRLEGAYKTYLKDSNLIVEENKRLKINKPLLDIDLEEKMKNEKLDTYLSVFLGV